MRFFGDATGLRGGARAGRSGGDVFGARLRRVQYRPADARGGGNDGELETRLKALARYFGSGRCAGRFGCARICWTRRRGGGSGRLFNVRDAGDFTSAGNDGADAAAARAAAAGDRMPAGARCGSTRIAFAEITSVAFDIPYTVATDGYSRRGRVERRLSGFRGTGGWQAVAIVAIVPTAGALGCIRSRPCRASGAKDTAKHCCARP